MCPSRCLPCHCRSLVRKRWARPAPIWSTESVAKDLEPWRIAPGTGCYVNWVLKRISTYFHRSQKHKSSHQSMPAVTWCNPDGLFVAATWINVDQHSTSPQGSPQPRQWGFQPRPPFFHGLQQFQALRGVGALPWRGRMLGRQARDPLWFDEEIWDIWD